MNRGKLLLALLISACSIDDAEPICDKGATQSCACESGETGAQSCVEDGFAWGECKCEEGEPEPTSCARDENCPSGTPWCVDGVCTGNEVIVVGGGERCDGAGVRCAVGLYCDPDAERCFEAAVDD
jgi:hypothetical protein